MARFKRSGRQQGNTHEMLTIMLERAVSPYPAPIWLFVVGADMTHLQPLKNQTIQMISEKGQDDYFINDQYSITMENGNRIHFIPKKPIRCDMFYGDDLDFSHLFIDHLVYGGV